MKEIILKNKTYALIGLLLLATIVLIIFGLIRGLSKPTSGITSVPTIIPVPTDASQNYSNLNRIRPGKDNYNDVVRENGAPETKSVQADKTYLYYPTPLGGYQNIVLLQNNLVVYALENVFGTYRGYYNDVSSSYGKPSIVLYDSKDSTFPWYIYLNRGIAVQSNQEDILAVIYFAPQAKDSFMQNIARELNLSEKSKDGGEPVFNQ